MADVRVEAVVRTAQCVYCLRSKNDSQHKHQSTTDIQNVCFNAHVAHCLQGAAGEGVILCAETHTGHPQQAPATPVYLHPILFTIRASGDTQQ